MYTDFGMNYCINDTVHMYTYNELIYPILEFVNAIKLTAFVWGGGGVRVKCNLNRGR
jgi:hypothetical protein